MNSFWTVHSKAHRWQYYGSKLGYLMVLVNLRIWDVLYKAITLCWCAQVYLLWRLHSQWWQRTASTLRQQEVSPAFIDEVVCQVPGGKCAHRQCVCHLRTVSLLRRSLNTWHVSIVYRETDERNLCFRNFQRSFTYVISFFTCFVYHGHRLRDLTKLHKNICPDVLREE